MSRRLFLAIPMPDHAASDAVERRASLEARCQRARWTRKENLHATVLFMGDVEDAQLEILIPVFREACRAIPPFTLVAGGFVPGPPRGSASMLWIGFSDSAAYAKLAHTVYGLAARELDLPLFRGDTAPHVTLARFRDRLPGPCAEAASEITFETTFEVRGCVLYESHLSGDGPTYVELERFAFSGQVDI